MTTHHDTRLRGLEKAVDAHMARIVSTVARLDGKLRVCIALALGIGSFGWGLSIALMPSAFDYEACARVVQWASPEAWGAVFMALGALLVASGLAAINTAVWPSSLLAITYSVMSISAVVESRYSDHVPTAIWAYLTLGAIAALLAVFCVVPTKG